MTELLEIHKQRFRHGASEVFHPPRQAQAASRSASTPPPLLRHQETEGAVTAERQRRLEQASQGGWQQQSRASLPEVRGVKGLALKKSLTSYWRC